MNVSALTYQDFERIFRACRGVLFHESVHGPALRNFLVVRLRASFPETAAKVRQLDTGQLEVLAHEIVQFHEFHSLCN